VAFFDMPVDIGYTLGYTVAATGPGIVIPCLVKIVERGYGIQHYIPETLYVTCAFDEIFAIVG
jgi:hypothetical protein